MRVLMLPPMVRDARRRRTRPFTRLTEINHRFIAGQVCSSFEMLSSHDCLVAAAAALILLTGCVRVPLRARQEFRKQQFFATHREVSSAVATAINTGHVVVGMDREEVWVVVGHPLRKSIFRGGAVEVWLYPGVRFHQGPGFHGADSLRLVFIDGRLSVIESI